MSHGYLAGWIPAGLFAAVLAVAGGTEYLTAVEQECRAATSSSSFEELALDVNGDGRANLLLLRRDGANELRAEVRLSDGSGFQRGWAGTLGRWCVGGDCKVVMVPMDVDGDGRIDLVRRVEEAGVAWADVWLSDGEGFRYTSTSRIAPALCSTSAPLAR